MFSSNMNVAASVSLLSLLLAKGIVSTSTTHHSRFDITKTLNDTIVEILQDTIKYDTAKSLSDEIKYHRSTYEIENTPKLEPFTGDKIYLHNIEVRGIAHSKSNESDITSINPSIYYDYSLNKMGLIFNEIAFKIYGYIGVEPNNTYVGFRATLEYQDFEINVKKNEGKLVLQMIGDMVKNRVRLQYWNTDDTTNTTSTSSTTYNVLEELIKEIDPLSKHHIPYIVRKTLTHKTKSSMPSILLDNMSHNKKFLNALNASFQLQPKQKIISQYPDLPDNEQQYYFSIPKFDNIYVNMEIRGLWNYELLYVKSFTLQRGYYVQTILQLSNISGSLYWNHKYNNVTPLKVNFEAGGVVIVYHDRVNFGKVNLASVQSYNFSVTEISSESVIPCDLSVLSKYTYYLINEAIIYAILPSVKMIKDDTRLEFEKNLKDACVEMENWFKKTFPETSNSKGLDIQSTSTSSFTTIKTSIPLNITLKSTSTIPPNETNTESTSMPFNHTTAKSSIPNNTILDEKSNPEPYNYQISFPNVTIKLITANHQATEQLQCQIFNNKEFTRQINAVMVGALHFNSKNNDSIALNFHCTFNSMNFSMIPPNGSNKNGTCEFQISNNQDIKIELPPLKNTTKTKETVEIKKKIDKTLLSMATQHIFRNVKSLACFPMDVCTQSVKMIDQYVLGFVDNVLKKCSLRRNKTMIG